MVMCVPVRPAGRQCRNQGTAMKANMKGSRVTLNSTHSRRPKLLVFFSISSKKRGPAATRIEVRKDKSAIKSNKSIDIHGGRLGSPPHTCTHFSIRDKYAEANFLWWQSNCEVSLPCVKVWAMACVGWAVLIVLYHQTLSAHRTTIFKSYNKD